MIRIYLLKSPCGAGYVGQTRKQIEQRLKSHVGSKNCVVMAKAIQFYGLKNFTFELLATASTQQTADALEQHFIAVLGTQTPFGYNVTGGGSRQSFTDKTRKKMSFGQKRSLAINPVRREKLVSQLKNVKHRRGFASPGRKAVFCSTNGKTYPSITHAAKELGLDFSTVAAVARGKNGMTHTRGFSFAYA